MGKSVGTLSGFSGSLFGRGRGGGGGGRGASGHQVGVGGRGGALTSVLSNIL